jgi:ABC-type transport system substrate-binding protein
MKKKNKNRALFFGVATSIGLVVFFVCFGISSQDNSKSSIRILLDHAPIAFPTADHSNSQSLDAFAKKFAALIPAYYVANFIPNEAFDFVPENKAKPVLHFEVVRDEVTRALLFLKGDADVLFDTLSLAKTEWMKKTHAADTQIFAAPGLTLSFLGFNFQHPLMADRRVRQAIASALPLSDWIDYKLFHWVNAVNDPQLPTYQPELARKILEEAGYRVQADGFRFHLRYYTTPVREGNELASLVREALKKIDIDVEIITLETSLYFDKIKRGDFDLMSSVWRRLDDHDSLADFLAPGAVRNYFHYETEASKKLFATTPTADWVATLPLIEQELPFFPLYLWKHGLVLSKRIVAPADLASHIDETFRFLSELDLKSK